MTTLEHCQPKRVDYSAVETVAKTTLCWLHNVKLVDSVK